MGNGLGAALGGFLCDYFGWRAAFFLQLPFIILYGVLALLACPDNLGPSLAKTQGKTLLEAFKTFDRLGAVGLIVTVTGLILGVNLGGNVFTWTHPFVITSLVIFAVAAVLLYFVERKAELPILPLKFLSTVPIGNLMWSNFFGSMLSNTILFNVPLYLQAVRQTSATTSGLYLVSPLMGISITAIMAGAYITVTRRMKPPMVLGTLFLLGGAISTASLASDTPTWMVPFMIPFCSIGQGFFFPAATIAALALNAQDEQAIVTTTLGLIRNLGSIMGVAVSSWILQNALLIYLNKYVQAPDSATKDQIIRTVRESIGSIRKLDPVHKQQVIEAYALSLRATFIAGVVFGVLCICLIWPAHLPRLQKQEDMDATDSGVTVPNDEVFDGSEEDQEEEEDERALLSSPSETMYRTMTSGTSRSRSSTNIGHPIERRASFDAHY